MNWGGGGRRKSWEILEEFVTLCKIRKNTKNEDRMGFGSGSRHIGVYRY